MAVIKRKKSGEKIYVTSSGLPPTLEEIELARNYDKQLQKKIKEITKFLEKNGFFNLKDSTKKWYMLGKKLHFLDDMELRFKCDPDLTHTWRILYDLAPHLAPSKRIPTDKERASGNRNHFFISYLITNFPWSDIKNIGWSNWVDICGSFSTEMWQDRDRLIEWVINKSVQDGTITRNHLRDALKAVRRFAGEKAKVSRDTSVLSKKELFKKLDQELKSIK